MRDALLVAELSTLVARLEDPGLDRADAVVYCAYFNDKMEEFRRVATARARRSRRLRR